MTDFLYWAETYSMALLLGISSVFTFFWLTQFRVRLHMNYAYAAIASILHILIGLVAVSLFAFLEDPAEYSIGVQSFFGGVFFMPFVYGAWAKFTKRNYGAVFDIFAVALIFTLMCARVNCLIAGCCLGDLIPGLDGMRWPTRELEVLFYIVLLLLSMPKVLKGESYGKIYPVYMMVYGIFRFITETLRVGNGWFHLSHVWALASFCIGAGFLLEFNTKKVRK